MLVKEIYLIDEEVIQIDKDLSELKELIGKSTLKDYKRAEEIMNGYCDEFNEPLIKYFGEDFCFDLQNVIYNEEFKGDKNPLDETLEFISEKVEVWPKYTILGGIAHLAYEVMNKIEENAKELGKTLFQFKKGDE
jgi:hypothetical protein